MQQLAQLVLLQPMLLLLHEIGHKSYFCFLRAKPRDYCRKKKGEKMLFAGLYSLLPHSQRRACGGDEFFANLFCQICYCGCERGPTLRTGFAGHRSGLQFSSSSSSHFMTSQIISGRKWKVAAKVLTS
jgi:hypothetical protein